MQVIQHPPNLMSPLSGDLAACFLWDRPSTPLNFPPTPIPDDSRTRCCLNEDETYECLTNSFRGGSLLIPQFTRPKAQRVQDIKNDKKPRGLHRHHITKVNTNKKNTMRTPEESLSRLRQMAQFMVCTSLFDEMKEATTQT